MGHYPTGVAVITARQADDTPVGMVVGTFTSVSLEPPLVGFLPSRSSTTWPAIREAGRFCANVLGADQEHVCRAFATKSPDRFTVHTGTGAGSPIPRVAGAVLWIDCDIEAVLPAGDHDIVLGAVRGVDVAEEAGMPLLFLRGGYGAPHLPSLQAEAAGLGILLRLADLVRPEAEAISRDLGLECAVIGALDDTAVMLAAAGIDSAPRRSKTTVGSTFPLAAPFGPLFVAWAPASERQAWLVRGQVLTGATDHSLGEGELAAVRALGYAVTTGHATEEHFRKAVTGIHDRAAVAEVLTAIHSRGPEPGLRAPMEDLADVTSMSVPVRIPDGRVVLVLHLMGFTGAESPDRLRACLDRLLAGGRAACDRLSQTKGDQ
jgi:flavin reductase (DIM6/NTAB) family NADH-FMN oxidoreductase RutF/DNA-binding IclR family transcriptional regulator